LIRVLKYEGDQDVRRKAALALGWMEDETAVEPLIQALGDKDLLVREAVAHALGRIGDKRAVEPLIQALRDKYGEVQERAAEALGEIGDERAIEPLIQALKDEGENVRTNAVWALGEMRDAIAVEPLIKALKDEDEYLSVQRATAEALGKIGDERAVEPLIKALKDEDEDVRGTAVWALGNIGGERAIELLINALKDVERNVREEAARALVRMGEPAVESLIRALRNKKCGVRSLLFPQEPTPPDSRAVEPLSQALNDSEILFKRLRRRLCDGSKRRKAGNEVPAFERGAAFLGIWSDCVSALRSCGLRREFFGAIGAVCGFPPASSKIIFPRNSDTHRIGGVSL
jgi:HEAT repeat protein